MGLRLSLFQQRGSLLCADFTAKTATFPVNGDPWQDARMDGQRRLKRLVGKPSQEGRIPATGLPQAEESSQVAPSVRSIAAAISGTVTGWIVSGSAGLMARPLEHALAWLGIGVILASGWPRRRASPKEVAWLAASGLAAVLLFMPAVSVCNVVGVALVLSAAAWVAQGADRIPLAAASYGVAVLALYRLAIVSAAVAWSASNGLGEALGALAGAVFGKPLSVGATFAGLDCLVLMAALGAVWVMQTNRPRWRRAIAVAVAVGLGHAVYLFALAHGDDLLAALPKPPAVEPSPYQSDLYVPPPWHWGEAVRWFVPWNLPLLAVVIHAVIAAAMFLEKGALGPFHADDRTAPRTSDSTNRTLSSSPAAMGLAAVALAAMIPATQVLSLGKLDLSGRKIVVYDHGALDWGKPQFDRFGQESAGHYGMLATYVQCLGAKCVEAVNPATTQTAEPGPPRASRSPAAEPSPIAALASGADALVVIHPTRPWTPEEIDAVWNYVRGGGSLLVVAEPHVWQPDAKSSFNELLAPVGMEVRFDTAMPAVRHWQHSVEPTVHPAALGIDDAWNGFGLAQGASIRHGGSAQPIVIGRWGWSDPGSDAVLTGVSRFDASERLGDLVLAAEQRVGRGRVVVLADASGMKNVGLPGGSEFLGRLLAYLASRGSCPQLAAWRQALGLAACLGLAGLLAWRVDPGRLAAAMAIFALFVGLSMAITAAGCEVLLDGRQQTPNPLVCIDASHLPAASGEPWSDDGLAGLQLTLMRNGYVPMILRRWNDQQIQRAGMLIAIGPGRAFSAAERSTVRQFLEGGGTMLCLAGANHAGPIESLLAEFNLSVPRSPLRPNDPTTEPRPMGYFRTPYLDTGKYRVYMGLYAGWPVDGDGPGVELLVRGFDDLPVVMSARVGRGQLFLFGDTYFAANKNLEAEDGRREQVFRENAVFWRWFLGELNGRKFTPPEPTPEPEGTDETMSDAQAMDADREDEQGMKGLNAEGGKP